MQAGESACDDGWIEMGHGLVELDALMREEKRLTALESQTEAWADGLSAGIEPELIAEVALTSESLVS